MIQRLADPPHLTADDLGWMAVEICRLEVAAGAEPRWPSVLRRHLRECAEASNVIDLNEWRSLRQKRTP